MKKVFLMIIAVGSLLLSSCGGTEKSNANNSEESTSFAESQPLKSGEYRALSFQYSDEARRNNFDGRMLVALSQDASGIYIYENGNRTKFSARLSLAEPFAKRDTIYVAKDNKGNNIELIPGGEADTLSFMKGSKGVKVAFERKAMSELTPEEAWKRITEKLEK